MSRRRLSKGIEEKKSRILVAMERIGGAAPVHYISQRCRMKGVDKLLQLLERDEMIRRSPPVSESMSDMPQYQLTGRHALRAYYASRPGH